MSYFSEKLAKAASSWDYDSIPHEVRWRAKSVLMDSLACIAGARMSEPAKIAKSVMDEVKGSGKSTIIGEKAHYPAYIAAFVNGIMLRYLDFMDTYLIKIKDSSRLSGGHPSETIPSVLAVAESVKASGKKVLAAIVFAYQLDAMMAKAALNGLHGFHYGTHGSYIIPVVLGYLLKLSPEKIAHAVGIGGMKGATLGIVDTSHTELPMAKSTAYSFAAMQGIQSTYLAAQGFTGYLPIFEGEFGLIDSVYNDDFLIPEEIVPGGSTYYISDIIQKQIPVQVTTIGSCQCSLELANKYDICPEEIKDIKIFCGTREANHCGVPERRHPRNKETADHSSFFVNAASLIDKEMTPEQYLKLNNKRIYDLEEKITVSADPIFDDLLTGGKVIISMNDGSVYEAVKSVAHGDPTDPLTDSEIENKFKAMVKGTNAQEIIDTIWELDKLKDISLLTRMLTKALS